MNNTDLIKKFCLWVKELGLPSVTRSDGSIPGDFNQLFQGAQLKNLWTYLMDNVKDENLALKVIGNLHLQNLHIEKQEKIKKYKQFEQELEQIDIDNKRLEEKIKQKKSQVYTNNINVSNLQKSKTEKKMKLLFHETQTKDILLKQMIPQQQLFKQFYGLQDSDYSSKSNKFDEPQFVSCCADVNELVSLVSNLYSKGLADNTKSDPEGAWNKAFAVIAKYPAKMIVDAFVVNAKHDKNQVIKCESDFCDHIKDEIDADDTSPIATIQAIMQKHHYKSKKELLGAVEQEKRIKKTLRTIEKMIEKKIDHASVSISTDNFDKDKLNAEIELEGNTAYLKSLLDSIKTIQSDIEKDEVTQQKINEQQQEAKNFSKELTRYKSMIIETTNQISKFRENLKKYQADSLELTKKLLSDRQPLFAQQCEELQTAMKDELSALHDADVGNLLTVNLDLKPVPIYDLSIYRPLKVNYECGNFSYQHTASLLRRFTIKSPSSFLHDVLEKQSLVRFHEGLQNATNVIRDGSLTTISSLKDVKERCANEQNHVKIRDWISQCKKLVDKLEEEESKLQIALNEWYDQPGQYQAPWMRVNGMGLNAWKRSKETL